MILDHTWEERSLIVVGSSSARPCDVKERSRKASACIPNNDDVTVALACERALELFTPSTSASTLATTAGWGGGSYDESVVAQYQIVGGPQRTTSAQDANADPDQTVCPHQTVGSYGDEPTRGPRLQRGADFDLRGAEAAA